eukprot:8060456-Pyramimonas_sp.AAC.1
MLRGRTRLGLSCGVGSAWPEPRGPQWPSSSGSSRRPGTVSTVPHSTQPAEAVARSGPTSASRRRLTTWSRSR